MAVLRAFKSIMTRQTGELSAYWIYPIM